MSELPQFQSKQPFQELAEAVAREVYKRLDNRLTELLAHERILDPLLSPDKVKRYLNISDSTLQHLRDSRQLAYIRVKGKYIYKASDIEQFVSSNYVKERNVRRLDQHQKDIERKGGKA